jgi:hypothetical protein
MPTNERQWDIRREGRRWSAKEAEERSCQVIPDRPEIHQGKLYFTDEERLAVTACLLENLGIDNVVQSLGSPALWQAAVASLNVPVPTSAPATLSELADQAAAAFGALDRELDEYFAALQQLDPELAERAVTRAGGRELAALLLLCPSAELGGKSALQLWAAGERQELQKLLTGD